MVFAIPPSGAASALHAPQELIEGIESMQILYGVDTSGDRLVDDYVKASAVANWNTVISLTIALLIRSVEPNSITTRRAYVYPARYDARIRSTIATSARSTRRRSRSVIRRNEMGMPFMSSVRVLSFRSMRAQRGAALVTSLVLLLILTVIGIAAMQMTRMQERMAGNTRDLNLAFQGAEAGIRDGESLIRVQPAKPDDCTVLPCEFWQANLPLLANPETRDWTAWWKVYGDEYESAGGNHNAPVRDMPQLNEDPRFVVQYITKVPDTLTIGEGSGAPPGRDFYLVTGRAPGGTDRALAVVQSTFARR